MERVPRLMAIILVLVLIFLEAQTVLAIPQASGQDHLNRFSGSFPFQLQTETSIPYGIMPSVQGSPRTGEDLDLYCDLEGTWDTSWGTMVISQAGDAIYGEYEHDEGQIEGFIDGYTVIGTWSEAPTYEGPHDAGCFVMTLSDDCESFSATWGYGERDDGSGTWTGTWMNGPEEDLDSPLCDATGTWDTSWGELVMDQEGNTVQGDYEHDSGHIEGSIEGDILMGTWSEAPTYEGPDDAGGFVMTFSDDCESFSATWGYGERDDGSGTWTGTWVPDDQPLVPPDLTILYVTYPKTAVVGKKTAITAVISNKGQGNSEEAEILFSMIAGNEKQPVSLGTISTDGGVPAGTSQLLSIEVLIPPGTTPGNYRFGAEIDPDDDINESDETNNHEVSNPATVSAAPGGAPSTTIPRVTKTPGKTPTKTVVTITPTLTVRRTSPAATITTTKKPVQTTAKTPTITTRQTTPKSPSKTPTPSPSLPVTRTVTSTRSPSSQISGTSWLSGPVASGTAHTYVSTSDPVIRTYAGFAYLETTSGAQSGIPLDDRHLGLWLYEHQKDVKNGNVKIRFPLSMITDLGTSTSTNAWHSPGEYVDSLRMKSNCADVCNFIVSIFLAESIPARGVYVTKGSSGTPWVIPEVVIGNSVYTFDTSGRISLLKDAMIKEGYTYPAAGSTLSRMWNNVRTESFDPGWFQKYIHDEEGYFFVKEFDEKTAPLYIPHAYVVVNDKNGVPRVEFGHIPVENYCPLNSGTPVEDGLKIDIPIGFDSQGALRLIDESKTGEARYFGSVSALKGVKGVNSFQVCCGREDSVSECSGPINEATIDLSFTDYGPWNDGWM
jgi:hypothetical protein